MAYETKSTEFSGVMKNAYSKPLTELKTKTGTPLPKSLPFKTKFDAFLDIAGVREANEYPTEKQIVVWANNQRKAAARTKAQNALLEALEVIKPDIENDPQLRLRQVYDAYRGAKKDHATARAMASAAMETEWEDSDGEEYGSDR